MATTPIKFPALPTGLTLTVDVVHPTTLAVLQAGIACTEASEIYSGNVTGSHAGQLLFVLKASGSIIGSRLRTIEDTTDTFVILTELEKAADDGRGAYRVTITIDDGTDPLEDVTVRVTGVGKTITLQTDANGVVKFALDNGDYDVVLSLPGYESSVESLTVSGTTPAGYSMDILEVTPPASAGVASGLMIVYSELGVVEQDVPISVQFVSGPGTAGFAYDTKARTETSDSDGLVTFAGLIRNCTYRVWRGAAAGTEEATVFGSSSASNGNTFVVPASGDTFNMAEVVGLDAEAP